MKYPWSSLSGFPTALVIFVAILLVSGGLCGLQAAIGSAFGSDGMTGLLIIPGILELVCIGVSAIGIVVCLIGWMVTAIYRAIRKQ